MLNLIDSLYLMWRNKSDWANGMHCSDGLNHVIEVKRPYKFKPTKLPLYYESYEVKTTKLPLYYEFYEVTGLYISKKWVCSWKPLYLERSALYV